MAGVTVLAIWKPYCWATSSRSRCEIWSSRMSGWDGTRGPILGVGMCLGVGFETLSPQGCM